MARGCTRGRRPWGRTAPATGRGCCRCKTAAGGRGRQPPARTARASTPAWAAPAPPPYRGGTAAGRSPAASRRTGPGDSIASPSRTSERVSREAAKAPRNHFLLRALAASRDTLFLFLVPEQLALDDPVDDAAHAVPASLRRGEDLLDLVPIRESHRCPRGENRQLPDKVPRDRYLVLH